MFFISRWTIIFTRTKHCFSLARSLSISQCYNKSSAICTTSNGSSQDTMKAVIFDGVGKVKYVKDFPRPKIEKDTDVLVKVEYAGVCGTDVHIISGNFPALADRPHPLGHEFSGRIAETGSKVVFKTGQKVVIDPSRACGVCNFCRNGLYQHCAKDGLNSYIGIWKEGGWAQYVVVPQKQVYVLPKEVSTKQACLCEPCSCVSHAHDMVAPLFIGQEILILGAGIIGNIWVSLLHHQGHRNVTVSERNTARMAIVKKLNTGCRVITPDILEKEKKCYDIIIDNTGVPQAMELAFTRLQHGGKYLVFGCAPHDQQASINPFQLFEKELTIVGAKINPFSFPKAIAWVKAMGKRYLKYSTIGVKTFRLSQHEKALKALKSGSISKAVFKIK